ncbi:MAG: DUF2281 domain-containing protein [Spirulinaceae cyanobacterium]
MQHLQSPDSLTSQITERIQHLSPPLQRQVLDFVEFLLSRRSDAVTPNPIKPGTLTGLRGILKNAPADLDKTTLKDSYVDYLLQKYE